MTDIDINFYDSEIWGSETNDAQAEFLGDIVIKKIDSRLTKILKNGIESAKKNKNFSEYLIKDLESICFFVSRSRGFLVEMSIDPENDSAVGDFLEDIGFDFYVIRDEVVEEVHSDADLFDSEEYLKLGEEEG